MHYYILLLKNIELKLYILDVSELLVPERYIQITKDEYELFKELGVE